MTRQGLSIGDLGKATGTKVRLSSRCHGKGKIADCRIIEALSPKTCKR